MFRASDIFGRRPGNVPDRPNTQGAQEAPQKRSSNGGAGAPTSRTWDPATGKYVEEELPADVQELMGIKKKVKIEHLRVKDEEAWGGRPRALGPSAVGLAPKDIRSRGPQQAVGEIDQSAPSVEFRGFSKVELNDRYYEKYDMPIHGKPTFWTADALYFIYWQGEVQRWSICDSSSLVAVRAGQYPGWAYKEDHKHLCVANGWMEAWNGEWREPELEVTYRSAADHQPQWNDPALQKSVATIEFSGFTMKELNTRYFLRPNEVIQGKPSYWDKSGVYFVYWQRQMNRWAICDLKCLQAVREGQCPGWAYRSDANYFANAAGWMERRAEVWAAAVIETAVIGASSKGLKVEFSGFSKEELNTQYAERPDEEIQGRPSFWDSSGTYFIYWQSSMARWALCDRVSLSAAKSGLAPGWAYRTDGNHFARSSGWMEVWGREWKAATVTCTVLEGTLRGDALLVKSEVKEESGKSASLTVDQYRTLIQKIYAAKNPAKLGDVPYLLDKYKDREHELYQQVCDKYEVDADAFTGSELPAAEVASATVGENESQVAPVKEENTVPEDADMPELTAGEFAIAIQSVYEQYNPKKLMDIARLLQKYRHRERELYDEVCKKYGVHPAQFYAKLQERQAADGKP